MRRLRTGNQARPAVAHVGPEALEALAPEWSALWRRCPGATPFLAPEWLLPWARRYAPGRTAAVTLRAGGRLVALAPVFCWRGALLLAGTGPSDHAGPLVEPGAEAWAPLLLAALPNAAPEPFQRIDLRQLLPASPALAPLPRGWREELGPDEPSLVAGLHGEDGLGALSRRRRGNWRYALRRLVREGGDVGLAAPDEIGAATRDLVRLHGLRWRANGEPGVLSDPLLEGLLLDAAPGLGRAGLLRLWQARLDGARIAALMVLAGGRTHHYYIGGFDPGHARLSPATVLIGAAMSAAHAEGAAEFDFLRGAEPYKRDWGAEERPAHRRVLFPPRSECG